MEVGSDGGEGRMEDGEPSQTSEFSSESISPLNMNLSIPLHL